MSLADIQSKAKLKPPKLVIYGPGGIGKTSFVATMDKAIIVQTEDGIGKIECDHFPVAKTYDEFLGRLNTLLEEEHDYKVVAIDSLDWLENLIHNHVCEQNGWNEIGAPAFGKGFAAALEVWKDYVKLLDDLRDQRNLTIVQIAHNTVKRYEDPANDPHDRHQIKLNNKSADLIIEHSDAVFFCNYKLGTVQVKGKGGGMTTKTIAGDRKIFTQEAPGYQAKNRYGLPAEMPFDWKTIREEMLK